MAIIRLTQKKRRTFQKISGFGFLAIGLYMILVLNDIGGQFPLFLGMGILLWRL